MWYNNNNNFEKVLYIYKCTFVYICLVLMFNCVTDIFVKVGAIDDK